MTRLDVSAFLAAPPAEFVSYFIGRIHVAEDGCWHWGFDRGVARAAQVGLPGSRVTSAYRVAHVLFGGRDISAPNEVIHHLCQNRSCINPRHLQLMTRTAHTRWHMEAAR